MPRTNATDLAGRRFGRLLVIQETVRRQSGSIVWLCRCDCGREVEVNASNLRAGQSSCGCQRGRQPTPERKRLARQARQLVALAREAEKRPAGGRPLELTVRAIADLAGELAERLRRVERE
jgi:hypothetical protein